MTHEPYLTVPIQEAKRIADQFKKEVVIILSWDQRHGKVNVVTFGAKAEHKSLAAKAGDIAAKAIGCDLAAIETHRDFRREYVPALFSESVWLLRQVIADLVEMEGKVSSGTAIHVSHLLTRIEEMHASPTTAPGQATPP